MNRVWGGFFLILIQFSLYSDVKQLYSERLEKNLLYKQALLKLEEAKLDLNYFNKNFIPTLSTGTSSTPGTAGYHHLGITNGEPDPFTINTQLVFDNIFGSMIGFSLPYRWDNEYGHRLGPPEMVVSRKLFAESGAGYLKVKAAVLENEYKIEELKIETGIGLTRDIFDAYYNLRSERIYSEYIDILKAALSGLKNEKEQNDMKRKIYTIKKLFLKAEHERDISELAGYSDTGGIGSIYTELDEIGVRWEQKIDELYGQYADASKTGETLKSKDIQALELSLEAAKKEAAFWFLPFLPNPALYASLAYDFELSQLYWGLGLSVTIPLVDHGERDLEGRRRKQGEEMMQLELDDKNTDHERTIKTLKEELEIIKIDMEILGLNREDAQDAFQAAGRLYANEIINENDYKLKKLDYELSELALIDKKGEYYTKLLNLLAEHYKDIEDLFQ